MKELLKNKNIIVLGGSGLLGKQIVKDIIINGGNPLILDIKKPDDIENFAFYQTDCRSQVSIEKSLCEVLKEYELIHGAIHTAYPKSNGWGESFEKIKLERLSEDLNGQLGSAIIFSSLIFKIFKKQRFGSLIHISSIQGINAPKFKHYEGTNMSSPIEYSAIKAGIISITKWLAKYSFNLGMRVNCISPGGIKDNQNELFLKRYREDCANIGMLSPNHISGTIIFLLSDQSCAINGQNFIIDDGWSL